MTLPPILSNLNILSGAPEMPNEHKRIMYATRHILLDAYGPLESRKCYCPDQCVFAFPAQCAAHGGSICAKHTLMAIYNGTGIYPTELRNLLEETATLLDILTTSVAGRRTSPGECYVRPK